jgi:alpha-methylacyl-CoA racemase
MELLKGYIALDLSSVGPAARAARMLADYGVEVIKVAPLRADSAVQIEPVFHAYGAGRGMKKIRIDLKSEQGRAVFYRLAGAADIVLESFRPGVVDRLGIGYSELRARNERIVYCSTSGYGQSGPCAAWAGHDINYLALSGFLACSGRDERGLPAIPGATVADSAGGGMHAVMAIMAALLQRERTGSGGYLDVAATEGVLSLMGLHIDQYLATGEETKPDSSLLTGKYACYGIYATRDGKALSVGAIEPHFFANLCRLLGLEQYSSAQMQDDKQVEMRAAFQERFLQDDRDHWVAKLAGYNTCVAPVLEIGEVAQWPQFRARRLFAKAHCEGVGEFEQIGAVLAGSSVPEAVHQVPAAAATDTRELLRARGLSEVEIEQLFGAGVVQ